MNGTKPVSCYRPRFRIEFLYRDTKQHCGLEHCRARSKNKLHFHFNAVLTAINITKLHWLDTGKSDSETFSMTNFKTLLTNVT
ncbi:MAG: transposase [Tannerella sp.]|nr:transposase [Tannerella sp.]